MFQMRTNKILDYRQLVGIQKFPALMLSRND